MWVTFTHRDQGPQPEMLLQVTGLSPPPGETLRFPVQTEAERLSFDQSAVERSGVPHVLGHRDAAGAAPRLLPWAAGIPGSRYQQRGCRWTPGWGSGMWPVFSLLHCVISRASCHIVLFNTFCSI